MNIGKSIMLLSAIGGAALMSTGAQAGGIPFESNGRTVEVRYQDLDLSKKADQRELKVRIRRAAVKVCPGRTLQDVRSCQLAAYDHVRAPVVAAIAKAQTQDAGRYAEAAKEKAAGAGN